MCGYRGNNLLRWLLGVIIITWIFTIGMKFGELKSSLDRSGYGYGMGGHMYRAMPMMGGSDFTVSTAGVPAMMTTGAVQVIKSN